MASGLVGTNNAVQNGISSLANIPAAINALKQQDFTNNLASNNMALQQLASSRATQGQNFAEGQARASQAIAAFNNYLNLAANDNGQTANAVNAALQNGGDPTKALGALPPSVLQSASKAITLLKASGADKDLPPQYSALFGQMPVSNNLKPLIAATEEQQYKEGNSVGNNYGNDIAHNGVLGSAIKSTGEAIGDAVNATKQFLFGPPDTSVDPNQSRQAEVVRAQNALAQINRQRLLAPYVPGMSAVPLNLQNGTVQQPYQPYQPPIQ